MSNILHTQFDESTQTIGANLAGWTVRGGGTPTRAPAYGDPAVIPVKRRYLPFTTDNTGDYRCVSWDAVDAADSPDAVDIYTAFTVNLTTVEQLHLYARGQGTGTVTDFYRFRIALTGSNNVSFDKMAASAYTGGVATATVTLSAGKSYFVHARFENTEVKVRIWDAALGMAGEPTTWNIDTTDASVTAAGWVALGGRHTTLTAKIAPFNFLAVGTDGTYAVCPRTNTEYTAYLASQTALRCVLAEMSATGYDSAGSPYTKTVNTYIANHGYTSHPQDTPAGKHYDAAITAIPTFRREMSSALSGAAQTGFGDLVVANPGSGERHIENRILRACAFDNASWSGTATVTTNAATPPPGRDRADQITDSSAVAFQAKTQQYTVPADTGTWRFTIDVKKTTGGTAPTFAINMNITGGTSVSTNPMLNTDTGATAFLDGGSVVPVKASDGTEFWRFTAKLTNNGTASNTTLTVNMYPAYAAPGLGSISATHTGSAIVSGAWLYRDPAAAYGNTAGTALDLREVRPGIRDEWLRMRWNRNYLRLYLGDPSWPKHDFRLIVLGRLGMPTAPDERSIRFPIADLSDAFNAPLQIDKLTTGDLAGEYEPTLIGKLDKSDGSACKPRLIDATTLTYKLAGDAIDTSFGYNAADIEVKDAGVLVTVPGPKVVTAVNAGTDTLTCVGHGLREDATVLFYTGTPPAPLALNTEYFVIAAGLTADDFRLSATLGGAAINITGGAGGTFEAYLYVLDKAAATLRLLSTPAGEVTVSGFDDTLGSLVSDLYATTVFDLLGLSLNFKDTTAFADYASICTTEAYNAGLWLDGDQHTAASVLARIAAGTGSYYGITPDGLMRVGLIDYPGSATIGASAMSFTNSDVVKGSIKLIDVIRSVDFREGVFTYAPLFGASGIAAANDAYLYRGRRILNYTAPSGVGIPLDDHPNQRDSSETRNLDTLFQDSAGVEHLIDHMVNLYRQHLGIYELETRLPATQLEIGQVITLTFPRLGWKSYSASDPASPDNTATIDATKAVVIGIDTDIAKGRVKLKVFRRIPGYYPTTDLN